MRRTGLEQSTLNHEDLNQQFELYATILDDLKRGVSISSDNDGGIESFGYPAEFPGGEVPPGNLNLKQTIIDLITSTQFARELVEPSIITVEGEREETEIDPLMDNVVSIGDCHANIEGSHELLSVLDVKGDGSSETDEVHGLRFQSDGHFVAKGVEMRKSNFERFKARVLGDDTDRQLFGKGKDYVHAFSPMLRFIPPFFKRKKSNYMCERDGRGVCFIPASSWGVESSSIARDIRVEIQTVSFLCHPLSSDEDILSYKLRTLVDSFHRDLEFDRGQYFKDRITALRRDLKKNPRKERDILREIISCHEMAEVEESHFSEKRVAISETWHLLRELREKYKLTTTNVGLKWTCHKCTDEEAETEAAYLESDLTHRAREISRLATLNGESKEDLEEIVEELKRNRKRLHLREPGETRWVPLIHSNVEVTSDSELNEKERSRLKNLSDARLYVRFMMGTSEIRSDDCTINRDFVASPNIGCHAVTMHIPTGIIIHIHEHGYEGGRELGTLVLPVHNGDPPAFLDYEFTNPEPLEGGRMIQGVIYARCFIEADRESLLTLITPGNEIKPRKPTPNARISVRKMLEIAEEHDPNDPYMISAISTMKEERGEHAIHGSFILDGDVERTLFASIAPSEICRAIEQRAVDIVRPSAGNTALSKQQNPNPRHFDVVTDPPYPSLKSFFSSILNIFKRKERRKPPSFRLLQSNTLIYLHLDKACFLPSRIGSNDKEPNIVVRATFVNCFVETGGIRGAAPVLNKHVELKIFREGERIPEYFDVQDKPIRIDLFDQVSESEKVFLATIEIPLSTLFSHEQVKGSVVLRSPPFYLGYEKEERSPRLFLSASVRPRLILGDFPLPNPTAECDEMNERSHSLWNDLRVDHPHRRFVFVVMTRMGESVLAPRMVARQRLETIESQLAVLTFVSLLGLIPDSNVPERSGRIWSTAQEFLDDGRGTMADHAIFLCNILLGIGEVAFVVLGNDISVGLCAYVLVRIRDPVANKDDPDILILLDPIGGTVFQINDTTCPVFDVGTVFNDENLWFNIQEAGRPAEIVWDFEDEELWIPFLKRSEKLPQLEKWNQALELKAEPAREDRGREIKRIVCDEVDECVEILRNETVWYSHEFAHDLHILLTQRRILGESSRGSFSSILSGFRKKYESVRVEGSPFFVNCVDEEGFEDILHEEIYEEIRCRELFGSHGAFLQKAVSVTAYPNRIYAIWILVAAVYPPGGYEGERRIASSTMKSLSDTYSVQEYERSSRNGTESSGGSRKQASSVGSRDSRAGRKNEVSPIGSESEAVMEDFHEEERGSAEVDVCAYEEERVLPESDVPVRSEERISSVEDVKVNKEQKKTTKQPVSVKEESSSYEYSEEESEEESAKDSESLQTRENSVKGRPGLGEYSAISKASSATGQGDQSHSGSHVLEMTTLSSAGKSGARIPESETSEGRSPRRRGQMVKLNEVLEDGKQQSSSRVSETGKESSAKGGRSKFSESHASEGKLGSEVRSPRRRGTSFKSRESKDILEDDQRQSSSRVSGTGKESSAKGGRSKFSEAETSEGKRGSSVKPGKESIRLPSEPRESSVIVDEEQIQSLSNLSGIGKESSGKATRPRLPDSHTSEAVHGSSAKPVKERAESSVKSSAVTQNSDEELRSSSKYSKGVKDASSKRQSSAAGGLSSHKEEKVEKSELTVEEDRPASATFSGGAEEKSSSKGNKSGLSESRTSESGRGGSSVVPRREEGLIPKPEESVVVIESGRNSEYSRVVKGVTSHESDTVVEEHDSSGQTTVVKTSHETSIRTEVKVLSSKVSKVELSSKESSVIVDEDVQQNSSNVSRTFGESSSKGKQSSAKPRVEEPSEDESMELSSQSDSGE
jgi:hypothetical protein